jgi:hypothetical protein
MNPYHLAQVNIIRLLAPLDHPSMADFTHNLERINLLGEAAPGFVWRLADEAGADATSLLTFEQYPDIATNLTLWTDIESLKAFTYRSEHVEFFKRRKEWAAPLPDGLPHLAMWWRPAADPPPSLAEARAKLLHLQAQGPGPAAFTFAQVYSLADFLATL